jgi:hypothetical protein
MSQVSTKETNSASKKAYHSPQLRKFGNVSDLTLTSPGTPADPKDGGGGFNQYNS